MTTHHVFRYDDFSETSGSRAEDWFFGRLTELNIPCTIAVVPAEADIRSGPLVPLAVSPLSRDRIAGIRSHVERGLFEIALHGYAHLATSHVRGSSEFGTGMERERQRELIRWGRKFLEDLFGVSIVTFVPPWNAYSPDTLAVLEEEDFNTISAALYGPVRGGALRYVPGTAGPEGTLRALRRARHRPGSLVVTIVHDYDLLDAGHERGIPRAGWERIFSGLLSEPNVQTVTIGQLATALEGEFGPARYATNLRRIAKLRRLPSRIFDRGRSSVYVPAPELPPQAFPTPIAEPLDLLGRQPAVLGLVSVILPVYNRSEMLREAVDSVLLQSHRSFEILIVDDCSTDSTPAVADELASKHPGVVRVIRQSRNSGPGPCRNRGLEQARGEFIQFLDSDDLLRPEKFERQIEALRRHPEAGVAYGLSMRGGPTGAKRIAHRTDQEFRSILPHFLWNRGWPTLAPLWRRSVCDRVGGFAPLRAMEDWHYDCRAGLLDVRVTSAPGVCSDVRDHPGDRASFGPMAPKNAAQWRDHLAAYESVAAHLRARGREEDLRDPRFFKEVFRAARQCGAEGFPEEAKTALKLASLLAQTGLRRFQVRVAGTLARVVGWRTVWDFSNLANRVRLIFSRRLALAPEEETLR